MTTKRIRTGSILEALFTSRARVAVLELLILNSTSRYYLREIASLTGEPLRAVQRELARLKAAGLLLETIEGNRKYYQANRHASVFPELKTLLLKTIGLGDSLRRAIQQSRSSISLAFLFGSYARGAEDATSDIDLMVIGEIGGRELTKLLSSPKRTLGREVNTVSMPSSEFRGKVADGNPFIWSVLQEPKIFLIGDEDELREIAGRAPLEAAQNQQG